MFTILAIPTRQTINPMHGLEIFIHTIILSQVYQMEGFSNRTFSSCNSEQLKISLKKSGTRTHTHTHAHTLTHTHTNTHTHTHTHTHTYTHVHTCIPTSWTNWTKAMLRETRYALAKWSGVKMPAYSEQNYYVIQKKYYILASDNNIYIFPSTNSS